MLGPPFPVVHNHLLCLGHVDGEVVALAPHGQVFDLLPRTSLSFSLQSTTVLDKYFGHVTGKISFVDNTF